MNTVNPDIVSMNRYRAVLQLVLSYRKKRTEFAISIFNRSVLKSSIILPVIITSFIQHGLSHPDSLPPVTLANTEVRILKSSFVKDMEYHIHIALPPDYKDSGLNYPVVYYTDAFYWGGIVIETYRLLRAFNEIPPMILVGISYDLKETNGLALRTRDFSPSAVPTIDPRSCGADHFLQFIEKELIPLIESYYRVNKNDRGLLGYSFGGLFNVYALFNRPGLFQKFLLGAPSLYWDDYSVLKWEGQFAATTQELPAKVFLAIGSEDRADMLKSWIVLRDLFNKRAYQKFSFKTLMLDGENHTSAIPVIYSRAFRFLYGTR